MPSTTVNTEPEYPIIAPQTITSRINEVARIVSKEGLKKLRLHDAAGAGKFNYRGIDDVYNLLSPLCSKVGLVITPYTLKHKTFEIGPESKKKRRVVINVRYMFGAVDSDKHIPVDVYGEAIDSYDKATAKAYSNAFRTMAIQVFQIPIIGTKDDPDANGDEDSLDALERVNSHQLHELRTLMERKKKSEEQIISHANSRGADITSLEELPVAFYHALMAAWTEKGEAK